MNREKDYGISNQIRKSIDEIAEEKNIAKTLYINILDKQTSDIEKLDSMSEEYENMSKVVSFFEQEFYKYILEELGETKFNGENGEVFSKNEMKEHLEKYNSSYYTDCLCAKIEEFGLEEYKKIVGKYNGALENLKQQRKLPTPRSIVESIDKGKPINLVGLVKNEIENPCKISENHDQLDFN